MSSISQARNLINDKINESNKLANEARDMQLKLERLERDFILVHEKKKHTMEQIVRHIRLLRHDMLLTGLEISHDYDYVIINSIKIGIQFEKKRSAPEAMLAYTIIVGNASNSKRMVNFPATKNYDNNYKNIAIEVLDWYAFEHQKISTDESRSKIRNANMPSTIELQEKYNLNSFGMFSIGPSYVNENRVVITIPDLHLPKEHAEKVMDLLVELGAFVPRKD